MRRPPRAPGPDPAAPSRTESFTLLAGEDHNWATLDAVHDIAASIGATPSQVALSWLTNRPGVIAPIIGARSLRVLQENLVGGDLELDAAAKTRLDEVSAPTPEDYPYGPFGEKQRGRYLDSSEQVISELF